MGSSRGRSAVPTPPYSPCTPPEANDTVSALDEFLASALPTGTAVGPARASLRSGGRTAATVVTGVARRLFMVSPTAIPTIPGARALLSLDVDDGGVRVDQPVEVVAVGERGIVLRAIAQPLVLRRRVVHDQSIAEALGVRTRDAGAQHGPRHDAAA